MKVVICGAGLIGTSIAKHLTGENNNESSYLGCRSSKNEHSQTSKWGK